MSGAGCPWRRAISRFATWGAIAVALVTVGCASDRHLDQPAISQAAVERFYDQHKRDFQIPETRYFDIDNLRSRAAALEVKREVEGGRPFSTLALHEVLRSDAPVTGRKRAVEAIFSAKDHVLAGPVLLAAAHDYSLFEVTRIVPSRYAPLADVRARIIQRMSSAR